jgi:hypothetical protein
MVNAKSKIEHGIDMSFIPTYKCNLSCTFCMYDCSNKNLVTIDTKWISHFLSINKHVPVRTFGIYGGEISVAYDIFEDVISLLPINIPKFTITNGTWSKKYSDTNRFLTFCEKHDLQVFVSNNKEQVIYQDLDILRELSASGALTIKDPDQFRSMGRYRDTYDVCRNTCAQAPYRFALNPYGELWRQRCSCSYPVVGDYNTVLSDILFDFSSCDSQRRTFSWLKDST